MQRIRGTKDILPNEIARWQHIYAHALQIFSIYNYHEVRTPIIENADVFLKSIGDSSDIISKEMYRFQDQGGRDLALRPEGTACISRAVASNKLYQANSIQKLWYIGPMFRYERPQLGRQRQFHQLGCECIGSNSPLADAEVINIANTMLAKLNYKTYRIEINSLGTIEERKRYKEDFKAFLEKYKDELDTDSKKRLYVNPLRILDSKNAHTQEIITDGPCLSNYLEASSRNHFNCVREHLEASNISYEINYRLVRGLDYYNHTAFEIIDASHNGLNTVCGGGRYSNLVKQFGGPDLSGVGWAIGLERLLSITKDNTNNTRKRFDIITEGHEAQKKSWKLMQELENNGINFNLNLSNQSMHKKIKKAAQSNSLGCLIIGSNEVTSSTITVKWLREYYQETISDDSIIKYLRRKLGIDIIHIQA